MLNLAQAKSLLLRTHTAAIALDERARAYCLQSGPGVGKSEGVYQYVGALAVMLNRPVGMIVRMLTTITSPDVNGFMIPTKNPEGPIPLTGFSFPPWFPGKWNTFVCEPTGDPQNPVRWYREGEWQGDVPEHGVVFLDEWGQAEDDVKKPAAELLLNGNVGTFRLPKGWRVVCATNRMSDRSGVLREMLFIVNRRGLVPVRAHLETWLTDFVYKQDGYRRPHGMTIAFARKHPHIVFKDEAPDGTDAFCTPRSLCIADREMRAFSEPGDTKLPMDEISRAVCDSWVGEGTGGQFFGFLKFFDELPDIEDIEQDPMGAKIPTGEDGQMVVSYMIAEHVNENNASAMMKYVMRLSGDMTVMGVSVMKAEPRRAAAIFPTPEYRAYQQKYKDVLIAAA